MRRWQDRRLPKPCSLDTIEHKYTNPFLMNIENRFHQALAYQHKETLENAKRVIPTMKLTQRMLGKYKKIHLAAQKDKEEAKVDTNDLIVVELLNWFKEEFFEWVDSPICSFCNNETVFSHTANDPMNVIGYIQRTEIFICVVCSKETPFPRYNDVNILLETRKGRCGEWANVFTLMCCAMDFDARLVVDETDHVWTEVYSHYQKRWLHCDPCENVCDAPLMYEHGWKKKLSYVMAYSPFELQDVTWRYTSNYKEVLNRRNLCMEYQLVTAIMQLRNERLLKCTKAKRDYVIKRAVLELSDFLTERQPGEENYGGRTSGSLDWRIARGDTSQSSSSSYCFKITFPEFSKMEYSMKYSCSTDKYIYDGNLEELEKWNQGTHRQVDMMRKVEKDWNKTYLCRKEGTDKGSISWMFNILDTNIRINSVYIKFQTQTFENGQIEVYVRGNTKERQEKFKWDLENDLKTMAFHGCGNLCIEATLSGGVGSTAWQHAQLFRQNWKSHVEFYPFEIFITFLK